MRAEGEPGVEIEGEIVRRVGGDIAVDARDAWEIFQGKCVGAADDLLERVHLEGEGGDDAEIAAAAAEGPEEIGMVVRVDGEELSHRR